MTYNERQEYIRNMNRAIRAKYSNKEISILYKFVDTRVANERSDAEVSMTNYNNKMVVIYHVPHAFDTRELQ